MVGVADEGMRTRILTYLLPWVLVLSLSLVEFPFLLLTKCRSVSGSPCSEHILGKQGWLSWPHVPWLQWCHADVMVEIHFCIPALTFQPHVTDISDLPVSKNKIWGPFPLTVELRCYVSDPFFTISMQASSLSPRMFPLWMTAGPALLEIISCLVPFKGFSFPKSVVSQFPGASAHTATRLRFPEYGLSAVPHSLKYKWRLSSLDSQRSECYHPK